MPTNNVASFKKKEATRAIRPMCGRVIERLALPIGVVVAITGPAMLLALSTGGFLAFVLLMANDLCGVGIGAFLFLFRSKTRTRVLSLEPVIHDRATSPVKRAA